MYLSVLFSNSRHLSVQMSKRLTHLKLQQTRSFNSMVVQKHTVGASTPRTHGLLRSSASGTQSSVIERQQKVAREFATFGAMHDDPQWLLTTGNGIQTPGDVLGMLFRMLAGGQQSEAPNEAIEEAVKQKYHEKLLQRAKQQGFESVEALLGSVSRGDKANKENDKENDNKKSEKSEKRSNLPSFAKSLDQIIRMDLVEAESPERIATIWNQYHAGLSADSKSRVSACIDAGVYAKLHQRGLVNSMFILPLPRDSGYELYLMQFSGHQIYYTPLQEYKLHGQNARPSLVVTHYTDLQDSKGIVLMLGELNGPTGTLSSQEAQNLCYQTQLFYVSGGDEKLRFVETFNKNPAGFDYQELIKQIETLPL